MTLVKSLNKFFLTVVANWNPLSNRKLKHCQVFKIWLHVKFLMLFKGSLLPPLTDLLSRIEGSGPQENASFLNHFDYIKVRQMALFTAVLFWVV